MFYRYDHYMSISHIVLIVNMVHNDAYFFLPFSINLFSLRDKNFSWAQLDCIPNLVVFHQTSLLSIEDKIFPIVKFNLRCYEKVSVLKLYLPWETINNGLNVHFLQNNSLIHSYSSECPIGRNIFEFPLDTVWNCDIFHLMPFMSLNVILEQHSNFKKQENIVEI